MSLSLRCQGFVISAEQDGNKLVTSAFEVALLDSSGRLCWLLRVPGGSQEAFSS